MDEKLKDILIELIQCEPTDANKNEILCKALKLLAYYLTCETCGCIRYDYENDIDTIIRLCKSL